MQSEQTSNRTNDLKSISPNKNPVYVCDATQLMPSDYHLAIRVAQELNRIIIRSMLYM